MLDYEKDLTVAGECERRALIFSEPMEHLARGDLPEMHPAMGILRHDELCARTPNSAVGFNIFSPRAKSPARGSFPYWPARGDQVLAVG